MNAPKCGDKNIFKFKFFVELCHRLNWHIIKETKNLDVLGFYRTELKGRFSLNEVRSLSHAFSNAGI